MRWLAALVLVLAACGGSESTPISTSSEVPRVLAPPPTLTSLAPATTATTIREVDPEPTTTTTTTTTPPRSLDEIELQVVEAASGFTQPVLMLTAPGDDRWFVVDQPGVIWVFDGEEATKYLDINDLVTFRGERGLLGMAFDPDYAESGRIYINYIDNSGDTVVALIESDGERADRGSLTEVLRIDQPAGNHNGGMIAFGPDGNLWIGMGDGGGSNDQFGQGQREDTLLGAMLRIDVDGSAYSVPAGNLADEVWAIGLRNPWRFAFDGDDLWIADVGQNRIEEVDVVDYGAVGLNFGWPIQEGTECFASSNCDPSGLVQPIYEYSHSEGCSVTGGYVYRGSQIPELHGHYFFSDYCTGWLRSVSRGGELREWLPSGSMTGVTGFGVDVGGELYVLTAGGTIFAVTETG